VIIGRDTSGVGRGGGGGSVSSVIPIPGICCSNGVGLGKGVSVGVGEGVLVGVLVGGITPGTSAALSPLSLRLTGVGKNEATDGVGVAVRLLVCMAWYASVSLNNSLPSNPSCTVQAESG
jgi:hypothetical protein